MIYAYTKHNLGDDLLIRILCERYLHIKFYLYTYPEYKTTFKDLSNLKVFSNRNIVAKFINLFGKYINRSNLYENELADKCDACVYIGGSLFIQGDNNWQSYIFYLQSRIRKNKPFYLLDANFGPYYDEGYFYACKNLFKQYEDICFRETYSLKLFSDLPNVRCAPDIAFIGNYKVKKCEKRITISVIDLKKRDSLKDYYNSYVSLIVRICEYFSSIGYYIDLLSFCSLEGDEEAIQDVLNKINFSNINYKLYKGNLDEIIECINNSEFVIATRFHAMILGWVLRKKVLPIIYSSKMEHILEDIEYLGPYINIKEINLYNQDVLLEKISEFYNCSFEVDIDMIARTAEEQFCKLDLFLCNK